MATAKILQRLYSLNTSSPDFTRYLSHLIQSDKEDPYLLGLQGSELTRLVDFLDTVRALPSAPSNLRNRFHRPSPSSRPLTMSPDCVYTSCKPSAATTASCRLRTLLLVASPKLAIIRSPLEASPMYGKGCTIKPKCVSNARGSTHEIARTLKRSTICMTHRFHVLLNGTCWHIGVL